MANYSQNYLNSARKAKKDGNLVGYHKSMEKYYDHRYMMTASHEKDKAKSLDKKAKFHRNSWKNLVNEEANVFKEEAPANAVGGGNIAGIGVGPQGEPSGRLKKPRKRNKILSTFREFIEENLNYEDREKLIKHHNDKVIYHGDKAKEFSEKAKLNGSLSDAKNLILSDQHKKAMQLHAAALDRLKGYGYISSHSQLADQASGQIHEELNESKNDIHADFINAGLKPHRTYPDTEHREKNYKADHHIDDIHKILTDNGYKPVTHYKNGGARMPKPYTSFSRSEAYADSNVTLHTKGNMVHYVTWQHLKPND